ncbi:MAG: glucose-1-phosphate adenylyltransferase subunit GlgD [Ruthenibacterium sp.]
MVSTNALGIIFPNTYDSLVPELVRHRTMASVPFGGRYRMIDFCLSGMVNSGIQNVTVVVKKNYHSLMDHLGNGREWDLARKHGGLNIVPPFSQSSSKVYHGRVEALGNILGFLKGQKEKYVVISDCNIASDLDFADLLERHVASGADVTMVYEKAPIPEALKTENYTFIMDATGRMNEIRFNDYRAGVQNLSMNVIVMSREELIIMVSDALVHNYVYFERDILAPSLSILNVQGYEYKGYRARVYNLKSYFDENMRLLEKGSIAALFPPERPVYTKLRDEAPARYAMDSAAKTSLIADGCLIEGTVENCVLFRGVKISKGATVKNCVLMQGTVVEENVSLAYVVTDKNVTITTGKKLTGDPQYPVFVDKGVTV